MRVPLTILLIDQSPFTSIRLVELLQHTEGVNNVFYAKEVGKGCKMFSIAKIDVMVLATHLLNAELVRLEELCRLFECRLILLSKYTHISYWNWCRSIGITHVLDKASEINEVKNILETSLK